MSKSAASVQHITRATLVVRCLQCRETYDLTDVDIKMETLLTEDDPTEFACFAVTFAWTTPGQMPNEDNVVYIEDLLCQSTRAEAEGGRARRFSLFGTTGPAQLRTRFAFSCLAYVADMDPDVPRNLWATFPDRTGSHFAVKGPGE